MSSYLPPDELRDKEQRLFAALTRARVAEARVKALEAALREVHEFHCGCDRPGNPASCVATPIEEFAALAVKDSSE